MNDPIHHRVQTAVTAALDKKAIDLDVLEVTELTSIADYFVLCSATSERQTAAIADGIVDRMRADEKLKPLLVEGTTPGRWILIDAGPADDGGDAGRRVVLPFLKQHGVRRLALAIVSHAHRDHLGGVCRAIQPGTRC